jgi:predicted nucleic acid-binding protein
MASSVFIETSIPSAYVSNRADASSFHRRDATQLWWREQLPFYSPFVSDGVIDELNQGDWAGKRESLALVEPLERLAVDSEVTAVAQRYVDERLVPHGLGGDALHLATACIYEIDFLLSWNVRHLANPNKQEHLTLINRRLGLLTPLIVTHEMLRLE